MRAIVKKTLAKKNFKVKCLCIAFILLMVMSAALALNVMFASASMPKIWLDSPAKGKVVNVNTRLLIRPEPGNMSTHSGAISNGTTLQIIGYTEYDPSDPWSPWLAIDTSKTTLLESSAYSIGWVSSVYVNVPVTGIKMTQTAKDIKIGTTANTGYTVIPPCADNTSVTWSSSNTSVATVDGYGKVTARAVGTAVITVRTSDGGKVATCTYTVKPLVSEITLNKTTSNLGIGKSETLTATILPTDAFDKSLTWSSSDTAIAAVDQNGKVTGKTVGTVTITAAAKDGSGKSASCTYTILPLVNSVTLNKDSTELNIGETEPLFATVLPDEAYDKTLTWSSTDSSVASVDQKGVITAKSSGTTTIKAVANDGSGTYDTCTVTVKSLVTGIKLNKSSSDLIVGQSEMLTASVEPIDASDSSVTWSSSDETIAVVDENGNVTALRAGNVTITASAKDGSGKSASCEYMIEWRTGGIALNKLNALLKVGTSDTLTVIFGPDIVGREVEWFSSDPDVVNVDSNGKVNAISAGTASITAVMTDGSGESASCVYTVKPLVNEIKLNKSVITIIKGQTEKLAATVNPPDAYDTGVTWSSDNSDIATVDQNGNIKGKSAGKTIIKVTAKDGSGVVAKCEVIVNIPVSHISIDKNRVIIKKGNSLTLSAAVLPTDANDKSLTWSSSNTNIVKVDQNGKVTAVNGGRATITAKANDGSGKFDTCEIEVIVMVESITLNKSSMSMSKGEQANLTATVKPDDATDKSVTWSSSDWAYARVDENGKVTALSSGIVYISATATDGSNVSANCEIIINYPRTGWVANIAYTASVNVRKSPNTTETVTTARYGRVLTVTAPAVDGWYPVILSDGTRGYISAQFVVWEKPSDPPKKTTTKTYVYVSKSGYPKSSWAGNQLKQNQKLSLKSLPTSSSSTVRSAPYASKGVATGKTSNGYYVSGGGGYQVVYGYGGHIQFTKPNINYGVLTSNDKQIVSKSNASVSNGCCGSSSNSGNKNNSDSIIDISESLNQAAQVAVEAAPNVGTVWVRTTEVYFRDENHSVIRMTEFLEKFTWDGSSKIIEDNGREYKWYKLKSSTGEIGYIRSDFLLTEAPKTFSEQGKNLLKEIELPRSEFEYLFSGNDIYPYYVPTDGGGITVGYGYHIPNKSDLPKSISKGYGLEDADFSVSIPGEQNATIVDGTSPIPAEICDDLLDEAISTRLEYVQLKFYSNGIIPNKKQFDAVFIYYYQSGGISGDLVKKIRNDTLQSSDFGSGWRAKTEYELYFGGEYKVIGK